MRSIRFDHIALAVPRLVDAQAILVGQLGGESAFGMETDAFRFWHWRYEGGGRLEVLEPAGEDGFLHRFLAQRGPGIHHVTFTVPSLGEACDRARAHGYSIVGYDDSDPEWKEAFLHPREAARHRRAVRRARLAGERRAPAGLAGAAGARSSPAARHDTRPAPARAVARAG
ncbi:MAG: hypothetical protein DMD96_10745 [Candidatus Rokuibacteriota bacterium]|nr:MAG: hypothetical protein DMD96_10745 [Candidatus Rokubacteria bacterium]